MFDLTERQAGRFAAFLLFVMYFTRHAGGNFAHPGACIGEVAHRVGRGPGGKSIAKVGEPVMAVRGQRESNQLPDISFSIEV